MVIILLSEWFLHRLCAQKSSDPLGLLNNPPKTRTYLENTGTKEIVHGFKNRVGTVSEPSDPEPFRSLEAGLDCDFSYTWRYGGKFWPSYAVGWQPCSRWDFTVPVPVRPTSSRYPTRAQFWHVNDVKLRMTDKSHWEPNGGDKEVRRFVPKLRLQCCERSYEIKA